MSNGSSTNHLKVMRAYRAIHRPLFKTLSGRVGVICGLLCSIQLSVAVAADPLATKLAQSRKQGADYLISSQAADGSWTSSQAIGITGLCTFALLQAGLPGDHPSVTKGLNHLKTFLREDGGIYDPSAHHGNYETAISLLAFQAAQRGEIDKPMLAAAEKRLRSWQWDEGEGIDSTDVRFGGAGYGRTGDRPDLSNTLFLLEALETLGATKDDPAVQRAMAFVSRCQNLESEHNTTPFPAKVNDGGFYYTPAAGGSSQAGETSNGGLRSYGSMTYAGFKSFIYAGLGPNDPRVKSAREWIGKHYTVTENPGMGQQGLFYYYQILSKSLAKSGEPTILDTAGVSHDWRKELAEQLMTTQKSNGAWVNENARWLEGDPNLATAYALIALKSCDPVPTK